MVPFITSKIGKAGVIGYGAMGLTWSSSPPSEEKAFEALKTAVNLGCNVINSADVYGPPENPYAGIELLGRFFTRYPEFIDKTMVVVKGGLDATFTPLEELDSLRLNVANINAKISPKKLDVYVLGRLDTTRPLEKLIKNVGILRDEGLFSHIGLSEVKGSTLEAANKITPIALAEVEYSLWTREVEDNGVLDVCKTNDIVLLAYSPLGGGVFSGTMSKGQKFSPADRLNYYDRYQPENLEHNLKLVDEVKAIAAKKGVTLVQLSLAWLRAQYNGVIPIPGSTRAEGVKEAASAADVQLTSEELTQIRSILDNFEVKGGRYGENFRKFLNA